MNPIRFRFLTILAIALALSAHLAHAEDDADDTSGFQAATPAETTDAPPAPVAPRAAKAQPSKGKIPYSSLSSDEREILNDGPISDTQYIAGGLVATFVGFGVGQAVEGRYMPFGIIFTVGEVASLSMIVAGTVDCLNSANFSFYNNTLNSGSCHTGLFTAGIVGFVGLRIWEIIDAWVAPSSINHRYNNLKDRVDEIGSTKFFITPVATGISTGGFNGAELAFQYKF